MGTIIKKSEHWSSICIYLFQYDFKNTPNSKTRMRYSSDQIPQIEYPTMVPRKFEPLCQGASADTKGKRNSNKSKSYCLSIDGG